MTWSLVLVLEYLAQAALLALVVGAAWLLGTIGALGFAYRLDSQSEH